MFIINALYLAVFPMGAQTNLPEEYTDTLRIPEQPCSGKIKFSITIPQGYTLESSCAETEAMAIFNYPSGARIYILKMSENDYYNPNWDNILAVSTEISKRRQIKRSTSQINEEINTILSPLPPFPIRSDSLTLSGCQPNGLYWKDLDWGIYTVGYVNVAAQDTLSFNKAIYSIKFYRDPKTGEPSYVPYKFSNSMNYDWLGGLAPSSVDGSGNASNILSLSPYSMLGANPVNLVDPLGCDTVQISYGNDKFSIGNISLAEGDDVFLVTVGDQTSSYVFNEGEYGNRVNMLNLEIGETKSDLTLGFFYVSGEGPNGAGFYVAPGGESSAATGSCARIPDGTYPIDAPAQGADWQKPGEGGSVASRGIRFHYGGGSGASLHQWTQGCFIMTSDYTPNNGNYTVNGDTSQETSRRFDQTLGASGSFLYKTSKGKTREGSLFPNGITHSLNLKSRR